LDGTTIGQDADYKVGVIGDLSPNLWELAEVGHVRPKSERTIETLKTVEGVEYSSQMFGGQIQCTHVGADGNEVGRLMDSKPLANGNDVISVRDLDAGCFQLTDSYVEAIGLKSAAGILISSATTIYDFQMFPGYRYRMKLTGTQSAPVLEFWIVTDAGQDVKQLYTLSLTGLSTTGGLEAGSVTAGSVTAGAVRVLDGADLGNITQVPALNDFSGDFKLKERKICLAVVPKCYVPYNLDGTTDVTKIIGMTPEDIDIDPTGRPITLTFQQNINSSPFGTHTVSFTAVIFELEVTWTDGTGQTLVWTVNNPPQGHGIEVYYNLDYPIPSVPQIRIGKDSTDPQFQSANDFKVLSCGVTPVY
jgi:hypothetical protein